MAQSPASPHLSHSTHTPGLLHSDILLLPPTTDFSTYLPLPDVPIYHTPIPHIPACHHSTTIHTTHRHAPCYTGLPHLHTIHLPCACIECTTQCHPLPVRCLLFTLRAARALCARSSLPHRRFSPLLYRCPFFAALRALPRHLRDG